MKKVYGILIITFIFQIQLFGQHSLSWLQKADNALFPNGQLPEFKNEAQLQEVSLNYLKNLLPDLHSSAVQPTLLKINKSTFGYHLSYTQQFANIPIFATEIKLNISLHGKVMSVLYKTVNTNAWKKPSSIPTPILSNIEAIVGNAESSQTETVIFPFENDAYTIAYKIEYGNSDGTLHRLKVVDIHNNILFDMNAHEYKDAIDTFASGMVFYPDPLTSARVTYGGNYVDNNDADNEYLNAERLQRIFPATFSNDTFFLKSYYLVLDDYSPPYTGITTSTNGHFNFTRAQAGFEDVNVFFHIHNFRAHLASLGFDSLGIPKLRYDAHALNGQDNSMFDYYNNEFKLFFGTGGIDDAEDADVIIHEYSHTISYAITPNRIFGSERQALDEAIGDYFACSYSRDISDYNWQKVYSWDGNETWKGRKCITHKIYPQDLKNDRYTDAELWAGSLMEIWENIGRDTTDKLMIGTLYSLSNFIKMSDAARIFVQMDSLSSGGRNVWGITSHFIDHGLLPESYRTSISEDKQVKTPLKLSTHLFNSQGLLSVEFDKPTKGNIDLVNMQGKILVSQKINNQTQIHLQNTHYAPGIYFLRINTTDMQETLKISILK